jgi:hypothetical protein
MSKPGKFVIPMLVATPLLLLLAQCSYGDLRPIFIGKKIWLRGDKIGFQQEIRRQIPIGSSITEARNTLELNGFTCAAAKEAKRGESSKNNKTHGATEALLRCQFTVSHLPLFITTYSSSIDYKNGIVTEVDANFSIMGP